MTGWDEIINKLRLLRDEPSLEEHLFYFEKYSTRLLDVLKDEKLETPISILIDGEWGAGKTTLLNKIHLELTNSKFRIILFNPWMYENLDPLTCLMQAIVNEFGDNLNSNFKNTVTNFSKLTLDIGLRKTFGVPLKDVKEHFNKIVKDIPNVSKQVEDIIKDQRLIILVDDLDRCSEDNALNILNSVKLFFNSKNVIFVIAADINTLQKAWELKYTRSISNIAESRKYFDKIFQIKISLPPKDKNEIKSFIKKKISDFPEMHQELILNGCPYNPRLIIKLLNTLYFNSRLMRDEKFETIFPLLIVWSILIIAYPFIAEKVRRYPLTIILLAYIFYNYPSFESFFFNIDRNEYNIISNPVELAFGNLGLPLGLLKIETTDCIMLIKKNREKSAFQLFRTLSLFYKSKFDELKSMQSQQLILDKIETDFAKDVDTIVFKTTL